MNQDRQQKKEKKQESELNLEPICKEMYNDQFAPQLTEAMLWWLMKQSEKNWLNSIHLCGIARPLDGGNQWLTLSPSTASVEMPLSKVLNPPTVPAELHSVQH